MDIKKVFLKPLFELGGNESNEVIAEKLLPILYNDLIDLSEFRYDLFTHRAVTTCILLAKEYDLENVVKYISIRENIKYAYDYLYEINKIAALLEASHDDCIIAQTYDLWHDESRYITDYLKEDAQPNQILTQLLKLYDMFIMSEQLPKHNIFSTDSTLFLEDYT